jgi:hypothetical protein
MGIVGTIARHERRVKHFSVSILVIACCHGHYACVSDRSAHRAWMNAQLLTRLLLTFRETASSAERRNCAWEEPGAGEHAQFNRTIGSVPGA